MSERVEVMPEVLALLEEHFPSGEITPHVANAAAVRLIEVSHCGSLVELSPPSARGHEVQAPV